MTPDQQARNAKGIHDCPNCNPNARAIAYVIALWIAAGIDKGE